MKRLLITLVILFSAILANADNILFEGFEYANQDGQTPTGWVTNNDSWLCGHFAQDHNRIAHNGDWYAYTNSDRSWMFMQMNMSTQLKYRFSLWAISDGGYQLEIWAGNEASPEAMTQLLLHDEVSSGTYEKFSTYVDEVASNYQYFGIHAVQSYCGDCLLTIDDINVDLVEKYALQAAPSSIETTMAPGTQSSFHFRFINVGYEPVTVFINLTTEHFSDIHVYANGVEGLSFHADPEEVVDISGYATLRPEINIGSLCWIDMLFYLDCGCATTMFTFWATAVTDGIGENYSELSLYPNPSTGNVTIEGRGHISIFNCLGQAVLTKEIVEKETITLEKGVYFVKKGNNLTEKLIVK